MVKGLTTPRLLLAAVFAIVGFASPSASKVNDQAVPLLEPASLPKIALVGSHYLSFNIEMAEVTGGEFWAPYGDPEKRRLAPRSPLALDDPRLKLLAKALGPTTIRVSGTWANSTYIPGLAEVAPEVPPVGFRQVLRHERWRALTAFARESGNALLLSFPASDGARSADGSWQEEQARRLVELSRANQARIHAVEFINEPNLVGLGSLPQGYRAIDYARDFKTFHAFARREIPEALILGHSASGRGGEMPAEEIAREAAGLSDVVSYHFYGALSERCVEFGNQTSRDVALSEAWLSRTIEDFGRYAELRDRFDLGKPIWLTETAQAACGGDRWASTFRDSFRFTDQLGRLAQSGAQLVAHNTLASGDYALVDRNSFRPRPNYWLAWLWRKTMGVGVLQPPKSSPGLNLYAHCHVEKSGAVSLVALTLDDLPKHVRLAKPARMSLVTANSIDAQNLLINGRSPSLKWLRRHHPPAKPIEAGIVMLPPHSIAFIEFPDAGNASCS